jgi:hypothetical protein
VSSVRSARIRWLAGVVLTVTLGVGAAACSSSAKTSTATTPPTSGLVGTSVPPDYVPAAKPVPTAALAAITKYLATNGPPIGTWVITSVQESTVNPSYVMYKISPAAGHEAAGATGYGFAQRQGTKWVALGFGTDAVGCPPGAAGNPVVPAKVLVGFSTTCAPTP